MIFSGSFSWNGPVATVCSAGFVSGLSTLPKSCQWTVWRRRDFRLKVLNAWSLVVAHIAETVSSYWHKHAVADDNHGFQKLLSSGISLTENPKILAVSADGSWEYLDLWYQSPIRPRKAPGVAWNPGYVYLHCTGFLVSNCEWLSYSQMK